MATDVVAFRFGHEELEILRRHGFDPAEEARRRLEGLLRAIRFDVAWRELRGHPARRSFDAAAVARGAREDLDRRR